MARPNHFTTHTVEGAKALNECGRYLFVGILRMETDCTNNGVTALDPLTGRNTKAFYVPCVDGPHTLAEMSPEYLENRAVILEVIPPKIDGAPYRLKVKGEKRWAQMGGSWAHTSDSRFAETYGGPIGIHDRHE